MTARLSIRIATAADDVDAIFRFRYRIYVDEMGRKQRFADYLRKRIEDPLDVTGVKIPLPGVASSWSAQ